MKMIDQVECFEITHVPREKNREADRLANLAMDRGVARRAPAVSGSASKLIELNGVVRNGVVEFLAEKLPEGTVVKVRPAKT
jgi:ribonuclease HI